MKEGGKKEKGGLEGEACGGLLTVLFLFFPLSYFLHCLGISSKLNQELTIKTKQNKTKSWKRDERLPFRRNLCARGVRLLMISVVSFLISRPRSPSFLSDLVTTFPTRFPPGIPLAEVTDDPIPS